MKTAPFQRIISLLLILSMAFTLALGCAGCGGTGDGAGSASAASMFLRKTEGTVAVADADGADIAPAENLGLYSGYTVGTEAVSYAWIDLDKVKLAKLDESSAAAITKDGKNLSIEITSGNMFFNVTEPLAEDETMEIRTSSMLVGIRGTCGWVEVPDSSTMRVYLLEGKVECTAGENTAVVNAGEMAEMTADGTIEVSAFTAWDVPGFVAEEMEADEALSEAVLAASGIDAAGNPMSGYDDIFAEIENRGGEVVFAEEIDFEADESPELLVIYTNTEMERIICQIYRKGVEQSQYLCGDALDYGGELSEFISSTRRKISLVESGGSLYVLTYWENNLTDGRQSNHYGYYGSTTQNDGDESCWGRIDGVGCTAAVRDVYYRDGLSESGIREGAGTSEELTVGECEAIIAQYTEMRVLLEI